MNKRIKKKLAKRYNYMRYKNVYKADDILLTNAFSEWTKTRADESKVNKSFYTLKQYAKEKFSVYESDGIDIFRFIDLEHGRRGAIVNKYGVSLAASFIAITGLMKETGCSKTDCSKALDAAHYDHDKAIQWLKGCYHHNMEDKIDDN